MANPIELMNGIQNRANIEIAPKKHELAPGKTDGSFSDMLSKAIKSVDETMQDSEQKVQDFVAGKTDNVHDVMISMQRAQLSFQMMVEVRNKAVEAYHEISRMQI